jgi:hypothetical protein
MLKMSPITDLHNEVKQFLCLDFRWRLIWIISALLACVHMVQESSCHVLVVDMVRHYDFNRNKATIKDSLLCETL